jgi:tetratricopeptide (TPR) repeat protein
MTYHANIALQHVRLAQDLIRKNKIGEALKETEYALRLEVNDPEIQYLHAVLLHILGNRRNCMVELERLVGDYPEHSESYNLLGVLHYQEGDINKALEYLKRAITCNPRNYQAIQNFLSLLVKSGRTPDALITLKHLLIQSPEDTNLHFLAQHVLRATRNNRQMEMLYEVPIEKTTPQAPPPIEIWLNGLRANLPGVIKDPSDARLLYLQPAKSERGSLSADFLNKIALMFSADIFIETGTLFGGTTVEAAKVFKEVHTIELSSELFQKAKQRFNDNNNVHVYYGDSATILKELLPNIRGRVVFWLDGHYSGTGTAQGSQNTPILQEIAAIKDYLEYAVILIDDIRIFYRESNPDSIQFGYPIIRELFSAILEIDQTYCFEILGDTAIAYPSYDPIEVSPVVRGCTISRFFDENPELGGQILEAEKNISEAEGMELEAIRRLCDQFGLSGAPDWSKYYALWYGLILDRHGQYNDALMVFNMLLSSGFNHWRIFWYLARSAFKSSDPSSSLAALTEVLRIKPDFEPARELMTQIKPKNFSVESSENEEKAQRDFLLEFNRFKSLAAECRPRFNLSTGDLFPCLNEKTETHTFDTHYIFHTAWAARILAKTKPQKHIDIGSSLYFVSIASAFIPIFFYDYRPPNLGLTNLTSEHADLCRLSFPNESIASLSCMHVIEHIGLGRYGDRLDPDGDLKAILEIRRVLTNSGDFLLVVPVGRPRILFNAHRIYSYWQILEAMDGFDLIEFALVPDGPPSAVTLVENATEAMADKQNYGCGCFWFKKNFNR